MLLLLALVKVNSAEAYGVARNFQRTMDRALKNNDDAELRTLCEEGYHTRILLSSANRYGIAVHEPYRPPSALRVLIGGIATAPMAIARPLTLAGDHGLQALARARAASIVRRLMSRASRRELWHCRREDA